MTQAAEIGEAWAGRLEIGRFFREGQVAAWLTGKSGAGRQPDVARLVAAVAGPARASFRRRAEGGQAVAAREVDTGGAAGTARHVAPADAGRIASGGDVARDVPVAGKLAAPRLRLTILEGMPARPDHGGVAPSRVEPGGWAGPLVRPVEAPAPAARGRGVVEAAGRQVGPGPSVTRLERQVTQYGARGATALAEGGAGQRSQVQVGLAQGRFSPGQPALVPPAPGAAGGRMAAEQDDRGLTGQPAGAPVVAAGSPPSGDDRSGAAGPTQGDVYLDGALMGRWMSRILAAEAARPASGGTAFDPRRNALPSGAMIGG